MHDSSKCTQVGVQNLPYGPRKPCFGTILLIAHLQECAEKFGFLHLPSSDKEKGVDFQPLPGNVIQRK